MKSWNKVQNKIVGTDDNCGKALGGIGSPLSFVSRVKFHSVVSSKWLAGKLMMESLCLCLSVSLLGVVFFFFFSESKW